MIPVLQRFALLLWAVSFSAAFSPPLRKVATFLVQEGARYSPTLAATIEKTEESVQVDEKDMMQAVEEQAESIAAQIVDDSCEIEPDTGMPVDELCLDEEKKSGVRASLLKSVKSIGGLVSGKSDDSDDEEVSKGDDSTLSGDALEQGCKFLKKRCFFIMNSSLSFRGEKSQLVIHCS